MPRVLGLRSLCLIAVLLPARQAPAGGRHYDRPPTADEIRVGKARTHWETQGLAAVAEMIAALCGRDEPLRDLAAEELVRLGPAAMPHLFRASHNPDCSAQTAMAAIICGPPFAGEMEPQRNAWDGVVSELITMAGSRDEQVAASALNLIADVADRGRRGDCEMRNEVYARAMPTFASRLRTRNSSVVAVLRIVTSMGPLAAPLVTDLIPLLQDEPRALDAMRALGAIGPKAAPAVPALRAMLRTGGDRRILAIEALGGIGTAASPAVADLGPVLKEALADLCTAKPRLSSGDTLVLVMAPAVVRMGGPAIAPLFPGLVAAYRRERACGSTGTWDWSELFVAAETAGAATAPALSSVALDPDEALPIRKAAVAALDKVGAPPAERAKLAVVRAAVARKDALFRRDDGPEPQIRAPSPPGSQRTPLTFALCRREAGLPEISAPVPSVQEARLLDTRGRYASSDFHYNFAYCIEDRFCGPDDATYRATMAACCKRYGNERPWFCEDRPIP